ncbi:MAG: hypothetical protein NVSMB6_01120 [Burkholderiaceae bacterium]
MIEKKSTQSESIAVVGQWCRVPGADSPVQFWENLCQARTSISRFSREQLLAAGVPATLADHPDYVPSRGVLEGGDLFDAAHFGITPSEAALTDPQHRQFLECAYLALNDAGEGVTGTNRVGVFATQSRNDYLEHCHADMAGEAARRFTADVFNGQAHLATSVAYRMGLNGPALTVQSACSSSLVAVHLACQALRNGECDIAIVGGVSIGWPQVKGHLFMEEGIMSRDGHCRPFDLNASGTVRGEGVGVVILKRLSDAKLSGNAIRSLILASAVNNDGADRMGFAAPSIAGQVDVIRQALARGDIDPGTVSYIETHGTGTRVGDAIELAALREAYALSAAPSSPIWLGGVKANIGHLDAAAGIIGLIKASLVLSHRVLPPQANFSGFGAEAGDDSACFTVATTTTVLPDQDIRRAAVSSFGLGGTNAHIVLEAAPLATAAPSQRPHQLLVLSARSEAALEALQQDLTLTAQRPGPALADAAFTLAACRQPLLYRCAFTGTTWDDIAKVASERHGAPLPVIISQPVAVHCGAQSDLAWPWVADIYQSEQQFRREFDSVAGALFSAGGDDIRLKLASEGPVTAGIESALVQLALLKTLQAWGLDVNSVAGTGAGHCVAAVMAGALSTQSAMALLLAMQISDPIPALRLAVPSAADVPTGITWHTQTGASLALSDAQLPSFWLTTLAAPVCVAPVPYLSVHLGTAPARAPLPCGFSGVGTGHRQFLDWIAQLWCLGAAIDWRAFYVGEQRAKVMLPPPPLHRIAFGKSDRVPATQPAAPVPAAATASLPHADSLSEVTAHLITLVEQILGISNVQASDDFFHLGGCSLTAIDLLDQLRSATQRAISLRTLLDHARLDELAVAVMAIPSCTAAQPAQSQTAEPKTLTASIADIFATVLGLTHVDSDDDFFHLGGCSLTAIDVLGQIRSVTGKEITLRTFLDSPSARTVALAMSPTPGPVALPPTSLVPHTLAAVPVAPNATALASAHSTSTRQSGPSFSVFFFAGEAADTASTNAYELILEAARLADKNGFEAVWVPERHFHKFGGLFPSPAVLGAALATATERVGIRAGSVVLPLHNAVEVVEQWSMVDNLSNGRVGLSLAPGFHPTDYTLQPQNFASRRELFWEGVDTVQSLWGGAAHHATDGLGRPVSVTPYPRPLQKSVPVWITASEGKETFVRAGERGANVLTALLSLDCDALAERIAAYRAALQLSHPGVVGKITIMLHTYVAQDPQQVQEVGIAALRDYLDVHLNFASARAEYQRTNALADDDRQTLLEHATARYVNGASLIGTPEQCAQFADRLFDLGVDEIACLIDFGVSTAHALRSLELVATLPTRDRRSAFREITAAA